MKTKKHPTEKELRRNFETMSRAIFAEMIDELDAPLGSPRYLWQSTAVRILRAWRSRKIALGVDSNLPDHFKIDPPVFVDGWVEDGEAKHKGAGHFSLFATFYDDNEAQRAWEIVVNTTKRGFSGQHGYNETGRRGGLDMPRCWARAEMFWSGQVERDLQKREAEEARDYKEGKQ